MVEEAVEDLGVRVCTLHLVEMLRLAILDHRDGRSVDKVLILLLAFCEDQVSVGLSRAAHSTLLC